MAGVTRLVSLAPDGASPDGDSTFPAVSADGCLVVFQSAASNLVPGDTPGADVFQRNVCAPGIQFEKVSVPARGLNGNGFSTRPTISGDGRWVAFNSTAQLIPEDVDAATDAYLRDMSKPKGQAGWLIRMSRTLDETRRGRLRRPHAPPGGLYEPGAPGGPQHQHEALGQRRRAGRALRLGLLQPGGQRPQQRRRRLHPLPSDELLGGAPAATPSAPADRRNRRDRRDQRGGGGGRQRPDRVLGRQAGAGYWLAASDGGMFAFGKTPPSSLCVTVSRRGFGGRDRQPKMHSRPVAGRVGPSGPALLFTRRVMPLPCLSRTICN